MEESDAERARDTGVSILRRQLEEEQATRKELFSARLRELFEADAPDTTGPDMLRALVEADSWFVPVRLDSSFDMVEAAAKKYRLAIGLTDSLQGSSAQTESQSKHSSLKRSGKGGRLLPIYMHEPDRPAVQLDGRALVRAIPEDVAGLLLHQPDTTPRELGREFFANLQVLADAWDLEEMLVSPGPGQVEKLKRATWLVEMTGQSLRINSSMGDGRLVYVYTHRDRAGCRSPEVVEMDGEKLFRMVAGNADVDGLVVNRGIQLGRGGNTLHGVALSPGFAHRLLEGEDIRPGVQPLPARSREEVELWLSLRRFPWQGRELIESPLADTTQIQASVPQASEWRMQETLGKQLPSAGPTRSPVFALPPAGKMERGLEIEPGPGLAPGPGAAPTRILCAGLLAKELNAEAHRGEDMEQHWRAGRWLLLGRLLDAADRRRSLRRMAVAAELARLLPPDADRIPRSALLTVEGAAVLSAFPHAGSRAWIEATLRHAERYTKRWVWWG